ncbi:DinB family protein [Bacillus salipaludis]|uniref:DinB family protein n=1 Tax=Bacillus salipaludis TaxID=2547811 RepID=A0A4R5VJV3_9BACI|nr:DinB family protein [Bacillus salipaludis]MDQ6595507.1 DinB family protein [Bacillus salipaludis]TDK57209.1 DinB family protein [Bacillus salipaludis]
MSELLFKHFKVTRNFFLKNIDAIDEAIVDIQPEGFNNTIHWHIGHVLTVAEQFMFGFPKKSTNLPENYMTLFATGTKPADWQGAVPSIAELTSQLKEQINRIKEVPAESLNERLATPFLGLESFGEIANFATFHEANHLGQIQAMKRVIEAASK